MMMRGRHKIAMGPWGICANPLFSASVVAANRLSWRKLESRKIMQEGKIQALPSKQRFGAAWNTPRGSGPNRLII